MKATNFVKNKLARYELGSEAEAWKEIQELRKNFNPRIFDEIKVNYKEEATEKATEIIQKLLIKFYSSGFDLSKVKGHGLGHITRDYINAGLLFKNLEANPKHLFIGFIGGSLHDIGCAVIPRYEESVRAVRHAEAGALFVRHLLEDQKDLNDLERTAIAYSIAAHTHYRKDEEVRCADNEIRVIKPYMELDEYKKPIWPIWFTRWVDRLDCTGPTAIGRHYLTLDEEHKDYDGVNYFDIKFEHYMKPLLRPFDEQKDERGDRNPTMTEYMKMFADSQTNESPYGRYDYGFMVELRDTSTRRLNRIIESTQSVSYMSEDRISVINSLWNLFLSKNIEPSELGRKTAKTLEKKFSVLNKDVRYAWTNGFLTTMEEYKGWAEERLKFFSQQNTRVYSLKPIVEDIKDVIYPKFQLVDGITQ